jgi:D-cysteine desulfhydrase family pyridoxal phosphate-dependent enzyme
MSTVEEKLDALPRLRLCQLPTPIARARRAERELGLVAGPEIWVKRDDLTGLAFGGNKGRKLEFCLAEAQGQGCDVVLTRGGIQSNHCRQTAVAAAALGMEAHLFLKGHSPEKLTGNLIPSALAGAHLHFVGPGAPAGRYQEAFAKYLADEGHRPYSIPSGAATVVGSMGYVQAVREIVEDQRRLGFEFDWVVHATGSSGTQAGLLAGRDLFGCRWKILGVKVSPAAEDLDASREGLARYANRVAQQLGGQGRTTPEDVLLDGGYVGAGYGAHTEGTARAVSLFARNEGIFLDHCYTAKAMDGLLDYVSKGRFGKGQKLLFVHTGGNLELFA